MALNEQGDAMRRAVARRVSTKEVPAMVAAVHALQARTKIIYDMNKIKASFIKVKQILKKSARSAGARPGAPLSAPPPPPTLQDEEKKKSGA